MTDQERIAELEAEVTRLRGVLAEMVSLLRSERPRFRLQGSFTKVVEDNVMEIWAEGLERALTSSVDPSPTLEAK